LGYAASRIPFAQHNQSPRISYYSAMSKQAMQLPRPPQCGQAKHSLCYAQQSLVGPESSAGINVVIAILALGYNIEDALVFNKAAVERGLFRSVSTHVYRGIELCEFLINDVLPAGTRPYNNKEDELISDITQDADGFYCVTTQRMRVPEVGDKFCSRAGQKGTVGRMMSQEDMPFDADGISPDVVINPHAFPSRMTVSQIYETACGMLRCYGVKTDARPFASLPPVQDALAAHGMARSGKRMMISGTSGQPLEAQVFMGLCFYQRLHHLSGEKCYSRRGGPVDAITKQPLAGRKQGGGLRLGEMEKDVLHSTGAIGVLQERMESIGRATVSVCPHCCQLRSACSCQTKALPVAVSMPHASKMLLMELQSMLIKVGVS